MYNLKLQQQMEQKPLTNAELEKATSRRSRKDEEGRDFQCGCGKRYLSYPALYTHIKTKHDGVQPQGTQKTGLNVCAKKTKGKMQEQTLKSISLNYVDREDLKILKQFDGNYIGQVPFHLRMKKESSSKEIYECFTNLTKNQEIKLTKNSSLDFVLTVYTLNVGDYVNQKLYDYYLAFAKLARGCFFEHGQEIYRNCFGKKQGGTGYFDSFSTGQVKYFPIICDFLTRYYIPFSESAKDCKDINISLMQLMIYDFCAWLLKKKLTFISVSLKKEYKLDSKPFLLVKQKCAPHKNDLNKDNDKEEESCSQEEKKQHELDSQLESNQEIQEEMNGHIEYEEQPKEKYRGQIIRNIQIINNSKYFQLQKKESETGRQKQEQVKNEIKLE